MAGTFRQKLARKRVKGPICAYGKLPVYKDFIRHRIAGGEAEAFRRWLDRGISRQWHETEECRAHRIEPHCLLIHPGSGSKTILGYLWGSSDEGGLRAFPFALFVLIPGNQGHELGAIGALAQLAEQAEELRRRLEGVGSRSDVMELLRQETVELTLPGRREAIENLNEATGSFTIAEFADSLYGEEGGVTWAALQAYLRRDGDAREGPSASALRLPISDRLPVTVQAQIWSSLVSNDRGKHRTSLIFPARPGESGITIVRRSLRPDDVFFFHPADLDYEGAEDMRARIPGGSELDEEDDTGDLPLTTLLEAGIGSGI